MECKKICYTTYSINHFIDLSKNVTACSRVTDWGMHKGRGMCTTGFSNSSSISCACASLASMTSAGNSASIKICVGSPKCS